MIDSISIDQNIGMQLRSVRELRGLSQKQLGERIGVSERQIFEYEEAINSLSVRMLYQLSLILCVPMEFFYKHPPYTQEKHNNAIPARMHKA